MYLDLNYHENPYIAGNPVGKSDAFVGRRDVFREVMRILGSPHENALVLFGQRRIGKTSVMQHLLQHLPHEGKFRTVFFDLQDKASLPLAIVLQELATRLANTVDILMPEKWHDTPRMFREQFLPQVLAQLHDDEQLVFLLDEFDVLDNPQEEQAGKDFFPFLRDFISMNMQRIQFLFVIGRRPEDLSSLTLSVFKGVKSQRVSLLSEVDTHALVRLAQDNETLIFPDETVSHIYALTGGHPYINQQLCQDIWQLAYENNPLDPPTITTDDVDNAVPQTISHATNALEWLWDGLKPAERVVAATLAEAGARAISQTELEKRLLDSGVRIVISELQNAPDILQKWDLIEPVDGQKETYRFRVELLRQWIVENKPLKRVQEEIDHINPVAQTLYQAGVGLYRMGNLEQAVALLSQAIGLNPNHVQGNQLLAEILLAQGELSGLVNCWNRYGHITPLPLDLVWCRFC
ncbi:MAG: hypothetical protein B6242_09740 [Anaerolineaceae bacterium 4572_78]|nr:MAG: hypothetical protein B6242_09740 [Anaerolineaceae bacterium 4572_78]